MADKIRRRGVEPGTHGQGGEAPERPGLALFEDGGRDPVAPIEAAPVTPNRVKVRWTQEGEDRGAFSEHGRHVAGEIVDTEHAAILIERGFAEAAE